MHPIIQQMLYYLIVFFMALFMAQFLTRGFFLKFMRVFGSFGSLIMVKIRTLEGDRFVIGKIDKDNLLNFKWDKQKCVTEIVVTKPDGHKETSIYTCLGVKWVDLVQGKGAVAHDFSVNTDYDPEKFEDLLTRALYKPSLNKDTIKIITLVLCIMILFGIIAVATMEYQATKKIDNTYRLLYEFYNTSINTGIVPI